MDYGAANLMAMLGRGSIDTQKGPSIDDFTEEEYPRGKHSIKNKICSFNILNGLWVTLV